MGSGAQLTVTDLRQATRHPVEYRVTGEHRRLGDIDLKIINISAHGFMTEGACILQRGERIVIRLPQLGQIEAHMIWMTNDRAVFQFERIIRLEDFMKLVDALQPNPRLRPLRR